MPSLQPNQTKLYMVQIFLEDSILGEEIILIKTPDCLKGEWNKPKQGLESKNTWWLSHSTSDSILGLRVTGYGWTRFGVKCSPTPYKPKWNQFDQMLRLLLEESEPICRTTTPAWAQRQRAMFSFFKKSQLLPQVTAEGRHALLCATGRNLSFCFVLFFPRQSFCV